MAEPEKRAMYPHFLAIPTRWRDNDTYGHVNNVVYYSYFDTVVNQHLIASGCLKLRESEIIGLVVETQCQFFKSITFPDVVHAGLRVGKLGNSSVRYEIALFANDDETAAAQGYFVHVYVDRATQRPTPIPQNVRACLTPLLRDQAQE